MVIRLKVVLNQDVFRSLMESAKHQLRTPEDQAAWILRQHLIRAGYLPTQCKTDSIPHEAKNAPPN